MELKFLIIIFLYNLQPHSSPEYIYIYMLYI